MKRYDIPGFAERLRALREARGLSLGELGKHLQTSRQAIHAYESGLSQPTLALAIKLADALDVSLDELVGRSPRNGHREQPPAPRPRRRQGAAAAKS
jgi:transcriptional regulator with XRE-family HTH domain